MSTTGADDGNTKPREFKADSLAAGVVFMLAINVFQRLIGFQRSIWFCQYLDDDQLGRWSLALSFLLLAAPLAVIGLPGSFGRYVEHYRQRGQLRQFLLRTTLVSFLLAVVATIGICASQDWLAEMIFNDASQSQFVLLLGASLIAVIAFNYVTELLTALRQVRAVTFLQFVNSVVFAVAALGLIWSTSLGAQGIAIGYLIGSVVACLAGTWFVLTCWQSLPTASSALAHRDLWSKLVPFAAGVWIVNLLANLFAAADRYMLVHFANESAAEAQALVGQYHSSRVLPVLMIAVAGMLSGVILPYMSSDWEAGRRQEVSRRLHLSVKLVALLFTLGGALILLIAPWLYEYYFAGKYSDGLAILPWTVTYCIWFSLGIIGQNYLWCAERAKLASVALAIGLVGNIALNFLLLPLLGLLGAVLATCAANFIALVLIYAFSHRVGMTFDRGTWLASALPLALPLGAVPTLVILLVIAIIAWRTIWLFGQHEKDELAGIVHRYLEKAKILVRRDEPISTREVSK